MTSGRLSQNRQQRQGPFTGWHGLPVPAGYTLHSAVDLQRSYLQLCRLAWNDKTGSAGQRITSW